MLVKEPPGFVTLADGAGEAFADIRCSAVDEIPLETATVPPTVAT